jgi:hypothetical protein
VKQVGQILTEFFFQDIAGDNEIRRPALSLRAKIKRPPGTAAAAYRNE